MNKRIKTHGKDPKKRFELFKKILFVFFFQKLLFEHHYLDDWLPVKMYNIWLWLLLSLQSRLTILMLLFTENVALFMPMARVVVWKFRLISSWFNCWNSLVVAHQMKRKATVYNHTWSNHKENKTGSLKTISNF